MIETALIVAAVAAMSRRSLLDLSWETFATVQVWAEARLGRVWPWAFGVIGLVLAALYVRPALETGGLGDTYAALSQDPFGPSDNPLSHRILTPLISWAVGLRGQGILLTNLILGAALLGTVASHFRAAPFRRGDAVLAGLLLTYSLVTLTTVYFGGYCDALTYLLIFLAWRARGNAVLFYVCIFLGLLNRESLAFLLPWLAVVRVGAAGPKVRGIAEVVVALSAVVAAYMFVAGLLAGEPRSQFDLGYYLGPLKEDPWYWIRRSVGYWEVGLFSVFRLTWCIPVWAAVVAWRQGRRGLVASMALLLACTAGQLAVAYDSSRMFTLGFMVMIVALDFLLREGGENLRRAAPWLVLANLLVPPVFTAADRLQLLHSPVMHFLLQRL